MVPVVIKALYGLALLPYAAFFGIAVYLFIAPCYDKLSGRAFVEFFQKIDPYMKVRAPLLSLAQLALTLPLLVLLADQWPGLSFWLTLAALLAATTSVVVAVRGNVPLNRQMDRWSPAEPPADWERVRDRWLGYHSQRGVLESAGFVLLLVAALVYTPAGNPGNLRGDVPGDASGMPVPRCLEATVYLPVADNEGHSFPRESWQEALKALVAPFGGATLGQPQEGCWIDSRGRMCQEQVRPVTISFPTERLDEFRKAVGGVGTRLGQEAMYVRFEESRVELIAGGQTDSGGGSGKTHSPEK